MDDIEYLILHENENTRLDFKREEYKKENHSDFLKDVLSMANAFSDLERFIIIGLKPKSSEDRGLFGIEKLTDSAIYQQLLNNNIEPEIEIEYFPFNLKGFLFGVFKIPVCQNKPYLMKKQFGNLALKLNEGDGFIRKGTQQQRLTLKDYNLFYQSKNDNILFNEDIKVSFITDNGNVLKLISPDLFKLPSDLNKIKIENIIKKKQIEAEGYKKLGVVGYEYKMSDRSLIGSALYGRTIPYEDRSIETLEKNLANLKDTYFEDDMYEIFEKYTNKCNLEIMNLGSKYIENASIIILIPKLKGLVVSKKLFLKPANIRLGENPFEKINYPTVIENDDYYEIQDSIGDVKHHIKRLSFKTHFRLLSTTNLEVSSIKIICKLFAKNLKKPIIEEIIVNISH